MYTATIPAIDYHAPWELGFDERMAMMMRGSPRAAYFYTVPDTSTFRYRAYNVAQSLTARNGALGASASWFTGDDLDRMGRVLDNCDVLVICRNALYTDQIARLAAAARARNRPVLFDTDDLVFDPAHVHLIVHTLGLNMHDPGVWDYWFAYAGRVGATFALCDGALVTNATLASHARAWSGKPARIIPNYLNREQQDISDQIWNAKAASDRARDGRMHLAYFSGSPSHVRDLEIVTDAIARLMDEDPSIWLRMVGYTAPDSELARHARRIESLPLLDFMNLQREIGAVEVNLVPLQENMFTHCKSELKWFEAAVAGAVTVASPTDAYRGVIRQGQNGWLADSQEWETILRTVVSEGEEQRASIASRAREEARERYGWDRQTAIIEAALFDGW